MKLPRAPPRPAVRHRGPGVTASQPPPTRLAARDPWRSSEGPLHRQAGARRDRGKPRPARVALSANRDRTGLRPQRGRRTCRSSTRRLRRRCPGRARPGRRNPRAPGRGWRGGQTIESGADLVLNASWARPGKKVTRAALRGRGRRRARQQGRASYAAKFSGPPRTGRAACPVSGEHELPAGHEALLVRERHVGSRREGGQRRTEARGAHDRVQDEVGAARGDQLLDARIAPQHGHAFELARGLSGGVGVGEGDMPRARCARRGDQPVRIAVRRERARAQAGAFRDHVEGLLPMEPVAPRTATDLVRGQSSCGRLARRYASAEMSDGRSRRRSSGSSRITWPATTSTTNPLPSSRPASGSPRKPIAW